MRKLIKLIFYPAILKYRMRQLDKYERRIVKYDKKLKKAKTVYTSLVYDSKRLLEEDK